MHPFSSFQIIRHSKRYLGPLQLISYALEIGLSIIKLQWPEFLIMHTFQLHASNLMFLPEIYIFFVCVMSLFTDTIPYMHTHTITYTTACSFQGKSIYLSLTILTLVTHGLWRVFVSSSRLIARL